MPFDDQDAPPLHADEIEDPLYRPYIEAYRTRGEHGNVPELACLDGGHDACWRGAIGIAQHGAGSWI